MIRDQVYVVVAVQQPFRQDSFYSQVALKRSMEMSINTLTGYVDLRWEMLFSEEYHKKHRTLGISYIFLYRAHSVQLGTFEFRE